MFWKRFVLFALLVLQPVFGADTQVSLPATGSATLTNLTASGAWASSFKISWNIYVSGYVHYVYTITTSGGNPLSVNPDFAVLEVSPTITAANLANTVFNPDPSIVYGPTTISPSSYVPGMPSSTYGLIFYPFDSSGVAVLEFVSTRTPMWGDIYLYGSSGYSSGYAYNKKFGTDPALGASSFAGWVPVPSAQVLPVPEPQLYYLLSVMLLFPLFKRRSREDQYQSADECL